MSIEMWVFIIWLAGVAIGVFLAGRFDWDRNNVGMAILWPLVPPMLMVLVVITPFVALYYLGVYLHEKKRVRKATNVNKKIEFR